MPAAQDFDSYDTLVKDVAVVVTTYRIGDTFHCSVSNKDPGATIARASAESLEQARDHALEKCQARL